MKLTFVQWLIQGIPECLAVATLGWVLLEQEFAAKKILCVGLLHALITFFVRNLPLPFGIHTLILIFTLAALLAYFSTSFYYSKVLFVSLITIMILGLLELITLTVVSLFLGIPEEAIFADQFLSVSVGLPQVVILFLLAYLIAYFKKGEKNVGKADIL